MTTHIGAMLSDGSYTTDTVYGGFGFIASPEDLFQCQGCGHTYKAPRATTFAYRHHRSICVKFEPAKDPGCPKCQ